MIEQWQQWCHVAGAVCVEGIVCVVEGVVCVGVQNRGGASSDGKGVACVAVAFMCGCCSQDGGGET
eukprot:326684-Rhodomonas_salina.1